MGGVRRRRVSLKGLDAAFRNVVVAGCNDVEEVGSGQMKDRYRWLSATARDEWAGFTTPSKQKRAI
jgi:hypothetical protein